MKRTSWMLATVFLGSMLTAGCSDSPREKAKAGGKDVKVANKGHSHDHAAAADEVDEKEIAAALAKLSPEDRKLAEEQKFCAVNTTDRLGEMGTPVKITVKGETVFLCCKGCKKDAESDADQTLATLKDLKAKNATKPAK